MAYKVIPAPHPERLPLRRLGPDGRELPGPPYLKKGKDRVVATGTITLRWNDKLPELEEWVRRTQGVEAIDRGLVDVGEVWKALKHANLLGGSKAGSTNVLINVPGPIIRALAENKGGMMRIRELLRAVKLEGHER